MVDLLSQPDFGVARVARSVRRRFVTGASRGEPLRRGSRGGRTPPSPPSSRAARAATGSNSSSDPTSACEGSQSTRAGAGALRSRWMPNAAAAVHRAGVRTAPRRRWDARGPSARAAGRRWRRPWRPRAWRRAPTRAFTTPSAPDAPAGPTDPDRSPATAARRVRPRRDARSRRTRLVRNARRRAPDRARHGPETRDWKRYRLDARETRGRLLSRLDPRGGARPRVAAATQLWHGRRRSRRRVSSFACLDVIATPYFL